MRVRCPAFLPALFFGSALFTTLGAAIFAESAAAQSGKIYPQIVRLSYIEGDVRVARGKSAEKARQDQQGTDAAADTGWETAVAGLPLQAGYSLVTGDGRAEIELENASTLYLGPNSVLVFNSLQSMNNATYTEASLLSGSLFINSRPQVPGDRIRLNTPSDYVTLGYPGSAIWRVDSYLDAAALTRFSGGPAKERGDHTLATKLGSTLTFSDGHVDGTPATTDEATIGAWNDWALHRIEARQVALDAVAKQAGLSQPLPGLDQLAGRGDFFSCGEYGTCWAPKDGWDGKAGEDISSQSAVPGTAASTHSAHLMAVAFASAAPPASAPNTPATSKPSHLTGQPAADAYLAAHPGATFYTEDYAFPCTADSVRDLIAVDPATGKQTVIDNEFNPFPQDAFFAGIPHRGVWPFFGYDAYWGARPWDWTVCHAGAWVRWHHRYVWAASNRRHHHPPVRWVHNGGHVGYVPIHPRDVSGKPPVNLKDGLFRVDGKHSTVERVDFEPGKDVKVLTEPPREFRNPQFAMLKVAGEPRAEAHSAWENYHAADAASVAHDAASIAHSDVLRNPAAVAKGLTDSHHDGVAEAHHQGVPIAFDRKTQSFSITRQISNEGGRTTTVSEPLSGGRAFAPSAAGGNNGGSQARSSGAGSNSSAGSHGSSSYGGSSGGGASRAGGSSGGGFSGGGGESHSGGAPAGGGGAAPSSSGGHK